MGRGRGTRRSPGILREFREDRIVLRSPWTLLGDQRPRKLYGLQVVVQTASGTVFTSARVPTSVHSGGVVPAPRLFTSLESNGTGVMDGMGNVHLLRMPRDSSASPECTDSRPSGDRILAAGRGSMDGSRGFGWGFGSPWMGALIPRGGTPPQRIPFPEGVRRFVKLCQGFNSRVCHRRDGHGAIISAALGSSAAKRPWRHFSHGYGFSTGLDDRGVLIFVYPGAYGETLLQEAEFPAGVSPGERIEGTGVLPLP